MKEKREKQGKLRKYRKNFKNFDETEQSDRMKGISAPPLQKPYPKDAKLIDLVPPAEIKLGKDVNLADAINNRASRRFFTADPLSLEELSFLLWCTQGIKKILPNGTHSMRTVPSGGALHPFETYLVISHVTGLQTGLYRYLPVEHKLLPIPKDDPNIITTIRNILNGQKFIDKSSVVFIWTTRPARTEWKYGRDSLKDVLLSGGHICQNLYLACEAIPAGICAIVAYQQDKLDEFLEIDGYNEISLYTAPVGKIRSDADKLREKFTNVYDLLQNGKFAEAIIPLKEITKMDPENGEAWNLVGICLIRQGKLEEARDVLQKVVNMDSTDLNSMYNLACVHSSLENPEESIKWLKKAIEGNPGYKDMAREDEDFNEYRDSKDFKKILE